MSSQSYKYGRGGADNMGSAGPGSIAPSSSAQKTTFMSHANESTTGAGDDSTVGKKVQFMGQTGAPVSGRGSGDDSVVLTETQFLMADPDAEIGESVQLTESQFLLADKNAGMTMVAGGSMNATTYLPRASEQGTTRKSSAAFVEYKSQSPNAPYDPDYEGIPVITPTQSDPLRLAFARRVLLYTAISTLISFGIIVGMKALAFCRDLHQRVPHDDNWRDPITRADELYLRQLGFTCLADFRWGEKSHKYANDMRIIHKRRWRASLGVLITGIVLAICLALVAILPGPVARFRNAMHSKSWLSVLMTFAVAIVYGMIMQFMAIASQWSDFTLGVGGVAMVNCLMVVMSFTTRTPTSPTIALWSMFFVAFFSLFICSFPLLPLVETADYPMGFVLMNILYLFLYSMFFYMGFYRLVSGRHSRYQFGVEEGAWAAYILAVEPWDIAYSMLCTSCGKGGGCYSKAGMKSRSSK
ncbi:unnamed protein product [Amoebophrya sp. A25]|nr:unnamed protein product [Amoebophrya sp. A25]|eukprot:GSA25T00015019001.1